MGAVSLKTLNEYVFPVENNEEELRKEPFRSQKKSLTAITDEAVKASGEDHTANGEDEEKSLIDPKSLLDDKKVSAVEAIKPFLQRRGAVVGESVPPDPGYWYSSSAKKKREGKGSLESSLPEDIRQIIREKILGKHPLFSAYSPFIQKLFEDAFEMRSYRAGEVVAEETDSSPFCYVLQGSIELLTKEEQEEERKKKGMYSNSSMQKNNSGGKIYAVVLQPSSQEYYERKRVKRRQGEDFGREGLLHFLSGERFGYTAIARVHSVVLQFSQEVYKKILMVHFLESHELLANTISHVRVFAGFSDAERSHIARTVKPMTFHRGEVLLAAGSSPNDLMIIEEGVVEVVRPMGTLPCRLPVQVKFLMPTECVGDAEIFSWDAFSPYDYVAYSSRVKVLCLDQDYFYKFHGHPLLEHLFDRINVKDVKTRKELVENLRHQGGAHHLVDLSSSDDEEIEKRGRSIQPKSSTTSGFLPPIPSQHVKKEADSTSEVHYKSTKIERIRKTPDIAVEGSRDRAALRDENDAVGGRTNSGQDSHSRRKEEGRKAQQVALDVSPGEVFKKEMMGDCATEDDQEEEDLYAPSVNIKTPEVSEFLLEVFFQRRAYCDCDVEECGTALTAFTSPRPLRDGTVLFSAEHLTVPGESEAVAKARRLRRRKENPPLDYPRQYLYVVYKGAIELLDREGAPIALITAGGSVGEHRLLKNQSAVCDVTARVVSTDGSGCEIIRLARRIYRHTLLRTFIGAYEAFQDLFSCLPFANDIAPSHLLVLHQCMELITLGPASVILAEHVTPREVYILLDGSVSIRFNGSSAQEKSSGVEEAVEVFHAQRGDGIGALELIDEVKARAAYITEGRVRVFRIPASQFFSVLRLVIPYFESLRETSRYRQLYGSARKVPL